MIESKLCACGGGEATPHQLGVGNCYREWVPRELSPQKSIIDPSMWVMPGGYQITDYTLKHQRMYYYHEEVDLWSRPKDHESVNSLEA